MVIAVLNVLIALKLAFILLGKYTDVFERLDDTSGTFDVGDEEISVSVTRQVRVLAWVVVAVSLIYLFGFVIATAVFIFTFVQSEADMSTEHALLFTVVATVFIYVAFVELLSLRMYEGLYGPALPLF